MVEPKFSKVKNGYDCAQVASFLLEMNRDFDEKSARLNAEIKRLTVLLNQSEEDRVNAVGELEQKCATLEETVKTQEATLSELSERVGNIDEAEQKAKQLLREASNHADEIVRSARIKGNAEAGQIVNGVKQKCSVLEWAITDFSDRVAEMRKEVLKAEDILSDAVTELERCIQEHVEN